MSKIYVQWLETFFLSEQFCDIMVFYCFLVFSIVNFFPLSQNRLIRLLIYHFDVPSFNRARSLVEIVFLSNLKQVRALCKTTKHIVLRSSCI